MNSAKQTGISIRMPRDLRELAEQEAKKQGRTLSNFIKYALIQYLENQNGISPIAASAL